MPDANYDVLQQRLSGMQAPQRVSLQESIIDAIPLAMSAFADDDGRTTAIVAGILDRKKQQENIQFQNELDLRRLQLDAALKGIQNEREKVESMYRNDLTRTQIVGANQKISQSAESFPVELQNLQLTGDESRQKIKQSEELFPLQKEAATAEAQLRKSQARENDARASEYETRIKVIGEYRDSPDPTKRAIGDMIAMTGQIPDSKDIQPEDQLKLGAAADPWIAAHKSAIEKGEDELIMAEATARLENLFNEKTQAIAPIKNNIVGDFFTLLKTQQAENPNKKNPTNVLDKNKSKQLEDSVIRNIAPYYDEMSAAGYGKALDQTIMDAAEHLTGITPAQLKSKVIKMAKDLNSADGQAKFIEDSLGPTIDMNDPEVKSLQEKFDEQMKLQETQQKIGEKKKKEEEQKRATELYKTNLKAKLMYTPEQRSGSYREK